MKAPTKSIFLTVVILGFVILTIALTFFTDFEYMTLISKSSYGSYKKIQVTAAPPPAGSAAAVPRLAYLIAGSKGQLESLWRTVLAVYHPRNQYVLHIDLDSAVTERMELIQRVEKHPLFSSVGNVHVVKRSNMVTYRGPTMVANTLHACAILLNISKDWDWFINLSAADYPLVSQDDILKMFSKVDRNMNFVEHSSNLGWKEWDRGNPLMIDPGLYSNRKADVFFTTEKRELPSQFKLFTGSAWMGLTREFVEYCILGIDNLPRTLLMYYTNFVSSPEGYFQTVICNSPEFNSTVVNNDLHYISWPDPPQQHPAPILTQQFDVLLASGAPFARKFSSGTRVLDMIDSQLLGRSNGSVTPGGWCAGVPACSRVGNISSLQLTRGFRRIKKKVSALNEWIPGSVRTVFKAWDNRLETSEGFLESNEGDPELLVFIPFTSDVKIKSISIIGGASGTSPSKMRAFTNREGIDFSDAQNMQPLQEWELAENLQGVMEYQTRYSRFQSVCSLTLHFPENFGGDTTQIYYIGLRGVATQLKRDVVATIVYEIRPNPSDHKTPTGQQGAFSHVE